MSAYQHYVFMDWRFVGDSKWGLVNSALNGVGVETMQATWDEMFSVKEEEVVEEVKVKKPRKKTVAKKEESGKKSAIEKKAVAKNKEKGKTRASEKITK